MFSLIWSETPILGYCTYLHIKMHNMDRTISEYQLLYGQFHLYTSPFLTYDAFKSWVYIFSFETQIFSLKML
jgi:hypothetical protein